MSSAIDRVLDRLSNHHLRPQGQNRWRCQCPAHDGNNRSTLSVGVSDSGAVLLKCFAGCDVESVLGSLGLCMTDLYPERPDDYGPRPRARRIGLLTAQQALDIAVDDVTFICVFASDLAAHADALEVQGAAIPSSDRERLTQCAARFHELQEQTNK